MLEILQLVKKRDLFLADSHILELEQECNESAAAADPLDDGAGPSLGGRRKAKDVELLYEELQKELWAVVRESLRCPTAGPNLGLVVQVSSAATVTAAMTAVGADLLSACAGAAAGGAGGQRVVRQRGAGPRGPQTPPAQAEVEGGGGGSGRRVSASESGVHCRGAGPVPGPAASPGGGGPGGRQQERGVHLPRGVSALPGAMMLLYYLLHHSKWCFPLTVGPLASGVRAELPPGGC